MMKLPAWKPGSNFDAFYALSADKQARIINAALAEFAAKGFKGASTNAIAQNAQIGKGMLFYYFGSKEELFDFLFQYAAEFAKNRYIHRFHCASGDFLERYEALMDIKRNVMREFPAMVAFFESFYRKENALYFEKYAADIEEMKQAVYGKIYDGMDYSLFRQDINGEAVIKYLKWLIDAYAAEITARFKQGGFSADNEQALAAEWEKWYAFTNDLRKVYYREGNSGGNY